MKINLQHVYTDKAGNKLYVKFIVSRDTWQWSAKNKEGKVVTADGVRTLMKRALKEKGHDDLAKKLPKAPGMTASPITPDNMRPSPDKRSWKKR